MAKSDREYLAAALEQARESLKEGGIPIGAVLVHDGEIIARGYSRRIQTGDLLSHAEIECLRQVRDGNSFKGSTLVTTLTPCYLCSGAAVRFGISKVILGESRNADGDHPWLESHGIQVVDMDNPECIEMLSTWAKGNSAFWDQGRYHKK